jgi:cyclopropane fatty-acyl-phospholipid synthase-like methyltransferase
MSTLSVSEPTAVMAVSCPICASGEITRLPVSAGGHGAKLMARTVAECHRCQHKFCPESVDDALVKAWYQGEWYFKGNYHHQNIVDIHDDAQWQIYLGARRAVMEQFGLRPTEGTGRTSLEIGCLEGRLVRFLADHGWQARGIEINSEISERGRASLGVEIDNISVSEWEPPSAAYDIVVSFHTFEHLIDPVAILRKVHSALKPGGQCLIEIPCDDSEFDNPDHLHFFSEASAHWFMKEVFGNHEIAANRYTDSQGRQLGSFYLYAAKSP